MAYVYLSDLGQNQFETDVDFGRKTAGFDRMVMTPGSVWGDEAFDSPADEDIDLMHPGMGQADQGPPPATTTVKMTPPPAGPVQKWAPVAKKVGTAIVVGGLILLAVDAWRSRGR